MRKFVTLALAAVFVVAMATYTLATEFKFGGSYRIQGIFWDTGVHEAENGATILNYETEDVDSHRGKNLEDVDYYTNRLRLEMDANVTEKLSAHVQADSGLGYGGDYRYHHPLATQDSYDGIWGRAYGPERFQDTLGMTHNNVLPSDDYFFYEDEGMAFQSHDIVFQRAYLKYESPLGTLKAGRQWAHWGSGILESMNRNRVELIYEKPTWFVGAGMDKMNEDHINLSSDDETLWFTCLGYTGETFQGGWRFEWEQTNRPDAGTVGVLPWPFTGMLPAATDMRDTNIYASSWYWKLRMGDLAFNGEYVYQWGQTGLEGVGIDAHGLTADATLNLNSYKVGTQFGYFTGDGNLEDNEMTTYITPYNFSPFLLVGEVPINGLTLTGRRIDTWSPYGLYNSRGVYHDIGWNANYLANCWFWKWFAEASPVKDLSVTGAVGYARANQAINRWDGAQSRGESIGTEMDITGTYKITDNLSYTAAWGYLWTGGFFDTMVPGSVVAADDNNLGLTREADNCFVFLHQIAITF